MTDCRTALRSTHGAVKTKWYKQIRARENAMSDGIKMYGAPWCGDCRRAKDFFDRLGVRYDWIDVDQNSDGMKYVEEINDGKRIIPTILFPDGSILVEPSNAELAAKLGTGRK
jgi:glutaredoxin-like protein